MADWIAIVGTVECSIEIGLTIERDKGRINEGLKCCCLHFERRNKRKEKDKWEHLGRRWSMERLLLRKNTWHQYSQGGLFFRLKKERREKEIEASIGADPIIPLRFSHCPSLALLIRGGNKTPSSSLRYAVYMRIGNIAFIFHNSSTFFYTESRCDYRQKCSYNRKHQLKETVNNACN